MGVGFVCCGDFVVQAALVRKRRVEHLPGSCPRPPSTCDYTALPVSGRVPPSCEALALSHGARRQPKWFIVAASLQGSGQKRTCVAAWSELSRNTCLTSHKLQLPWHNRAQQVLHRTGTLVLRKHNVRMLPACRRPSSGPKCGTTSGSIIRTTFKAHKFGDGQSVSRFCSLFPCRNPNPKVVPTNWCALYCCVSKTSAWHAHCATQKLASNNRSVCLHATHNVRLTGTCTRNKLAINELVTRLQPD
jgi:hypothetical protein